MCDWSASEWTNVALVAITAVYVLLTFLILRANRKVVVNMERQHELLTRPYMSASIEIEQGSLLVLVVRNEGRTSAEQLRMTLDSDFFQNGDGANLRDFSAFSEEIGGFPPNTPLRFVLGQGPVIFDNSVDENRVPKKFMICFAYRHANREYAENVTIDLRPFKKSNPAAN